MRLFVAVFPDEAVDAALDAAVAGLDRDRWRPVARERRHVTLRFQADADPDEVAADLRRRLGERAPSVPTDAAGPPSVLGDHRVPTLRCVGAGLFGTALWLGVQADDPDAWHALLRAAGTDPADHVAHLTVARGRGPLPGVLADHAGPVWVPRAVVLVASGSPYRVVEEFPLVAPPGADEAVGGPR